MKTNQKDKEICIKRMYKLFEMADKMFNIDRKYSDRYVELARKISTKNKVPIPKQLKRRFCRNCSSFLVPSVNSRIRNRNGVSVILCLKCKHISRYPFKKGPMK